MHYDAATGSLMAVVEHPHSTARLCGHELHIGDHSFKNGRFAYAANRLHDTIAIFEIASNGVPEFIDEEWTRGDYPRNISIDPTGDFMYSCNHRSDAITTFRIDGNGRHLRFTGKYTAVGSPAILTFL
jgi:6-phosphogluconolactonase (cycloisomerase 2 family)